MSGTSTHREKEAFFGGDGRARLFTKLFFPQGNYSQVLNNNDPDSILNTDAWSVMSAANYENKDSMGDNDIHWAFTDFIILTALFHREIDKNTKSGSYAEKLFNAIDNIIYEYFMDSNIDLPFMTTANFQPAQPAVVNVAGTPISDLLSGSYSNLDVLFAILVSIGASKPVGSLDTTTVLNFSLPYGAHSFKDFINTFVDRGTFIDNIFNNKVVNDSLNIISGAANNKLFKQQIVSDIKSKMPGVLFNLFTHIINEAGKRGPINAKSVYESFTQNNYKLYFIKEITQVFKGAINDYVNRNFGMNYTTASNNYVDTFINQVYQNWDTMSEDSKNFYRTVVRLFKFNNGKWEEVGENELKNAIISKDKYRVNLRKTNIGDQTPYFWNLIPKVPSNVQKIYYSDAYGKKMSYDLRQIGQNQPTGRSSIEDFFRTLYYGIYQDNGQLATSLPQKYDPSLVQSEFPGLWIDKIVRNRLFQIQKSSQNKISPDKHYNDEMFDFITQNIWKRSGDTLYTMKNGQKIVHSLDDKEFQNLLTSSNNCYTTGAFEDKTSCRAFMNECLLDSDPKNIMKCIRVMENQDFGAAAKKEISNMTPIVALNLLKKFGFRTYKLFDTEAGFDILKVENVSHWLKTYMKKIFNEDKNAQTAIENNDKILQYLNLVVEYVNANPGILNTNYSGPTEEKVGKIQPNSFAHQLGIPLRRDNTYKPNISINLLDASLRSNNIYGSQYRKPIVVPVTQVQQQVQQYRPPFVDLISPFSTNVGFPMLPPLSGGGYHNGNKLNDNITSGAYVSEALIFDLLAKLRQHNKVIDKEYMDRITQKLDSMKKTEKNMELNIRYIGEYVKLLDAFGDNKGETLSEQNLKNMVNSNYNLYKKHNSEEQSIVQILKTLSELAYGDGNIDDNDSYKEIDMSSVLKK